MDWVPAYIVWASLISTFLAIICSAITISNCVREHKLLISAKILIIFWIAWLWWLLSLIFSGTGQVFGIGSPFSMYLNHHPILDKAYMIVNLLLLYYVRITPWIMFFYLIIKEQNMDED